MDQYPVWQNDGVAPQEFGHIGPIPKEMMEAFLEEVRRMGSRLSEEGTEGVLIEKETTHKHTCPRSVDMAGFPLDI